MEIKTMEDKRKQFNVADFVSNEKTPVETREGHKVTIYSTDRNSEYKVCGDIHLIKDVMSTWMTNGKYQSDKPIDEFDLFFSQKKRT